VIHWFLSPMPVDHHTLPATVAWPGGEAAIRARIRQITSTYRAG
jgi:hypothetical protein